MPSRRRFLWRGAAVTLLAANAGAWWYAGNRRRRDPLSEAVAESPLWAPFLASNRPILIVLGDYYMFGEAPGGVQVNRLVREFSINSRSELDEYLMYHPERLGRYVDVGIHYLPTSTGTALRNLLPLVNAATPDGVARPRIFTMSSLTPDMLKVTNIIYIGFLSGLGLLRNALFGASNFAIGSSYDELIDKRTQRHYTADWSEVAAGRSPKSDYGYIASLPGPSGNHIVVISGTRDPAVMQTAESSADAAQMSLVAGKAGNSNAFEALYQVQTVSNVNFGSRLLLAYPLQPGNSWRASERPTSFPDEFQNSGRSAG